MHRVGRTGRAGAAGTAITLVGPSDAAFAAELDRQLAGSGSDGGAAAQPAAAAAAAAAAAGRAEGGEAQEEEEAGGAAAPAGVLRPFGGLTRAAVEGLRYRGEDVARSITKNVIKEVGGAGLSV